MGTRVFQNRYEIIELIGQGGMADVFKAYDTVLKRTVAIKVLRGELNKDPLALLRFKREAHASSKLNHPNIIEIYDVGEENNTYFIVMEFVEGKNLKQLILKRGSLMKEEAVSYIKQMASGLDHAHRQGVIHRDIKPQNIIVKDDGSIKILDFGIALAHDALQLTQSDSVMGSVHYLAPELAKGENASVQSDIYALGIVFYELLVGDVPFKGDQMVQIALQHINDDLPSIKEINSTIPQSIVNILTKSTAKNKLYRYQSAREMIQDLNTCLDASQQVKPLVFATDDNDDVTKVLNYSKQDVKPAKPQTKDSNIANSNNNKNPKAIKPNADSRKKNGLYGLLGLMLILIASIAIAVMVLISGGFNNANKNVEVPNIINLDYSQAKDILQEYGLSIDTASIERVLTADTPKGLIINVLPEVGSTVKVGDQLKVTISNGIYDVMGNYVGQNINDVKNLLKKYGNMRIIETSETNEEVAPGTILRQEILLPDTQFDANKPLEVKFVYAAYKNIIIPHYLIGMDVTQAKDELEAMGVEVLLSALDTSEMSEEEKEKLDYGTVIRMNPANGTSYTQTENSYITIYYY